jgi:Glycosyl hydrolase family 79 C-terminal beta domain
MRFALLRWSVIAACAILGVPDVSTAQGYSASVSVTPTPVSRPIPEGFLGLAFEYSAIPVWVGPGSAPPDPVLVQLIRNLDPVGRPMIRIGGLSTDHSWWPVPGMTRPRGVIYGLTPAWAQSTQALARVLNARMVLGVNLEANSPRLARMEADAFLGSIGRRYVAALDIGNEPPLYTSMPWYDLLGGKVLAWYADEGTAVFGRGSDWGPAGFVSDYARILAALPRVPIAGPDTQQASWFAAYQRFLSPHSRVRILASHGYGLNNCVTRPASPAYPSIRHLLSPYATRDLLGGLTPYVGVAHRNGAAFRIDEMGSITCNGRWGVSNTMASALWAADALFTVAGQGVDGVNLHSYPGLSNTLFDFNDSSRGWSGEVHPLYYGALLFAHAAPAGSRLVQVSLRGPPAFRAWATRSPGSARRVLLINDSLTDSAGVVVQAPAGHFASGDAQLERLSARSASATDDITLGGRTFGAATTSGRLRPPVRDAVAPHRGAYRVTVPAASAALLTFTSR